MKIARFSLMLLLCLTFYACRKDDVNPTDPRARYVGKYQCTEQIRCYGPCSTCQSWRDTVISVRYGATDSTIDVLGRDINMRSSSVFSDYHYSLEISNDSIHSTYMHGGLGCGQYEIYEGVRVSEEP